VTSTIRFGSLFSLSGEKFLFLDPLLHRAFDLPFRFPLVLLLLPLVDVKFSLFIDAFDDEAEVDAFCSTALNIFSMPLNILSVVVSSDVDSDALAKRTTGFLGTFSRSSFVSKYSFAFSTVVAKESVLACNLRHFWRPLLRRPLTKCR